MTPPEVVEAINTVAAYLKNEGYATAVISETGGATFDYESILDRQLRLYKVIDTLHIALQTADSTAASTRSILAKVRNIDSVFHAIAEGQEAVCQPKK
jgi:hypothetical protein